MARSSSMDREEHIDRWYRAKIGPTSVITCTTGSMSGDLTLAVGLYRVTATIPVILDQSGTGSGIYLATGQVEYFTVDAWSHGGSSVAGDQVVPYDGRDSTFSAIDPTGIASGSIYVTLINRLVAATP